MDLLSKFDSVIAEHSGLLATGVRDPFGVVMTEVLSPTRAIINGRETILVGTITDMRRETINGETWIVGTATYDTDDQAREAERLATEGVLSSVSLDGAGAESIVEVTGVDEYGDPTDWLERVTTMEIVGVTLIKNNVMRFGLIPLNRELPKLLF
jgi:hypothetical protein